MEPTIKLYNTKSRLIEVFTPITPLVATIYSCGPTVYHFAHIGNLRAYVFADVLRRTLAASGLTVTHVINITDVGHTTDDGDAGEDKMEKGSRREGKSAQDLAKFYEEAFKKDLTALNIPLEAYIFPRATETIPEQIAIIEELERKGYTYQTHDGVYFDTSKFAQYPDLAKLDIDGLQSGARVEENKEKKNITDFALWKFSPKNEKRQMEWDSPWGVGFPGWHIECSAMSIKYLGNHFDIHTGGIDHIPVHHTNELAQSECATGVTYVNYWMHVNFLHDNSGKMSKSNDDFLTLSILTEKGYDSLAYRYFLLTTHYRKELNFSYDALDAATIAYKKLVAWCEEHRTDEGVVHEVSFSRFTKALYDDVGTPSGIAELWDIIKDQTISRADAYQTVCAMSDMLGLGLENAEKQVLFLPEAVITLLEERKKAREEKNFTESDRLRDELKQAGFIVQDTEHGQEISK
jgi:cysteinyl-tRNA synthetase